MNDFVNTICVVAGEPSGDKIAADVVRALLSEENSFRFIGIGGDAMGDAGVELVENIKQLSALGFLESVKIAPKWLRAWSELRVKCNELKPKVALLVDCPDVNLPLARALKQDGVKVIHFFPPKVWAWRKSRLTLLKHRTDMVALGFQFEEAIYKTADVHAQFVGHPLVDESMGNKNRVKEKTNADKIIALLPGSRSQEIHHHSDVLIETGTRLLRDGILPVFAPYLPHTSSVVLEKARSMGCVIWDGRLRDLLAASDAAIVASGTVTLEAALEKVPMVIIYKIDELSWTLAKYLVNIPYIGLPNWIAEQKEIPEILQHDFSAQNVYNAALKLFTKEEQQRQKRILMDVSKKMGTQGVSKRVANLIREKL